MAFAIVNVGFFFSVFFFESNQYLLTSPSIYRNKNERYRNESEYVLIVVGEIRFCVYGDLRQRKEG